MFNHEIETVRFNIIKRNLEVKHIEELAPNLKKITFKSKELEGFTSLSPDDHLKIFFNENQMRDYTPMHFDQENNELTLGFHIHNNGVAGKWAKNVNIGDKITIGGPRGSRIVPLNFDWYFFIVDETGIPALSRYIAEIPKENLIECIIEVEDENHKIKIPEQENVNIHWVFRSQTLKEDIENIKDILQEKTLHKGDYFTWILQEKNIAMSIKEYLILEKETNPKYIKASGYWKKY